MAGVGGLELRRFRTGLTLRPSLEDGSFPDGSGGGPARTVDVSGGSSRTPAESGSAAGAGSSSSAGPRHFEEAVSGRTRPDSEVAVDPRSNRRLFGTTRLCLTGAMALVGAALLLDGCS